MGATPLRDRIRKELLDDVVEGRLSGEDRIRIGALAERFDVSPTPAREALTQLEAAGWVVLRPNRGFFVAPMTVVEAEAIYPVLATLEGLAVELQRNVPTERVRRLREINAEMEAASEDPVRAMKLDRTWHEALTDPCGNPVLLEHLGSVRSRAERYDQAYMRYSGRVPTSTEDHRRIADALEGDSEAVPGLLRENWERSLRFVREWWRESAPDREGSADSLGIDKPYPPGRPR